MVLERLTKPGATLGEGPLWDASRGRLLWVDIVKRQVHDTDIETGETRSIDTPEAVGTIAFDSGGSLVGAMTDGLYRLTTDGWSLLVELESSVNETRANEGKPDPYGNMVVGTMHWNGTRSLGSLYRVSPDLAVDKLATGMTIPNGLDWDDGSMWHIDSPTHQVRRYAYDPDSWLGTPDSAIDVDGGSPDGMCLDAEGCLWVAVWGGGAVRRYDPTGRFLGEIPIPASHVTSCAFGGQDLDRLFITTSTMELTEPEPEAGAVFVAEPGVTGRLANTFNG